MTNIKRIPKKTVAMILVMLTVFSVINTMFPKGVNAAVLSVRECDGDDFPYYRYHTSSGSLPKAFRDHSHVAYFYWTGGVKGKDVYCIEPNNHETSAGSNYDESTSNVANLNETQRELLSIALAYAYDANTKYGGSWEEEKIASQVVIWMIVTGYYDPLSSYGKAILTSFVPNERIGNIALRMLNDILSHNTVPSFANDSTYEMIWDEDNKTYSLTLTDTNGVLERFDFSSTDTLNVKRSGNTLTITGTIDETKGDTVSFLATKQGLRAKAQVVYMSYGSNQKMIFKGGGAGSVSASFKVKIKGGTLSLEKVSEDEIIEGMSFKVSCEERGFERIVETDSIGYWKIDDLKSGTYIVKEIETPDRYCSHEAVAVEVLDGGRIASVTFENKLKRAEVEIMKLSDHPEDMIAQGLYNKPLAGAEYGIFRADNDELITTIITEGVMGKGKSDTFTYEGNGEFYIKEITPPKYYAHDDTKYYFTMTKDYELFTFELKNETLIGKMEVWYKEVKLKEDSPKTGDNNDIYLYTVISGIAGAMLLLLLLVSKKKKQDSEQTKDLSEVISKVNKETEDSKNE